MEAIVPRSVPDPFPDQEPNGVWLVAAGIGALVLAVVLGVLVALGRAKASFGFWPRVGHPRDSGDSRPSRIREAIYRQQSFRDTANSSAFIDLLILLP
jgi:heme A synthase